MIQFLKKIFVILVLLVGLDLVFGFVMNSLIKNLSDGRFYKVNYTLSKANEDIIIIGSSRAEYDYMPQVLEDSLGMTCWNAGRGGQSLPFWYAMAKGITARYDPKIVILNIEPLLLSEENSQSNYDRMGGMLRPFYHSNRNIQPIIDSISPFESYKMLSNFYAFNSTYYYLLRPFAFKNIDGKTEDKGWKTKNKTWLSNVDKMLVVNDDEPLNDKTVLFFNRIIDLFDKDKTKIYVVIAPDYGQSYHHTATISYLEKMSTVKFLNLGRDIFSEKDNTCFQDPQHLNEKGALIFSKELAKSLKEDFHINRSKFEEK